MSIESTTEQSDRRTAVEAELEALAEEYDGEGTDPADPDDEVDIDALVRVAFDWMDEQKDAPTSGQVTTLFGDLVKDGANDGVKNDVIAELMRLWPGEWTKKNLEGIWRREEKDLAAQVRKEQEEERREAAAARTTECS